MKSYRTFCRRGIVSIILIAACFLVVSCRDKQQGAEGKGGTISVATFSKALGNAPLTVALSKGFFSEHPDLSGWTVSFREYNDRPTITAAFSQAQLDLLFSAEIPAILIRAQGEAVSIMSVSTYALQEILVPASSSVRSLADLRGKSLAVQAGTSSHFCLVKTLKEAGISMGELRISLMPAAEGKSAFETGRIDSWAVWAPWVETQEVSGKGRVLPEATAKIYSVATARNGFIQQHPKQTRALYEVIQQAKKWIRENPEEAVAIVSKELGFAPEVVAKAWGKFKWDAELDDAAVIDFQEKSAFLSAEGLSRDGLEVDVQGQMIYRP